MGVRDIYNLSRQFRAQLLAQDEAAAKQMVDAYAQAYLRLHGRLTALLEDIQAERKAGRDVPVSWLFRQERLEALQRQAREEMNDFAARAGRSIVSRQQQAALDAEEHARQLTLAGLGEPPSPSAYVTWNRLPSEALESLVGSLEEGSPLRALLDQFGPAASQSLREGLVAGLAAGQSPAAIARQIREDLGANMMRALTIARTEVLRSYREASIQSYAANDEVVKGWRWRASRSRRTCAACLAMDGRVFPNGTPFGTHPRCRCSPVPVTKTWAELGFPGVPEAAQSRTVETGAEWFERQPADVQLGVLGPGKLAAYRAGRIDLSDLVKTTHSEGWGTTRTERGLKDALALVASRREMRRAAGGGV